MELRDVGEDASVNRSVASGSTLSGRVEVLVVNEDGRDDSSASHGSARSGNSRELAAVGEQSDVEASSEAATFTVPSLQEATAGRNAGGVDVSTLKPGYSSERAEANARLRQKSRRNRRLVTIVKSVFLVGLVFLVIAGCVVPWYVTMRQGISGVDRTLAELVKGASSGVAAELLERLRISLQLGDENADDASVPVVLPLKNSSDFRVWARKFQNQVRRASADVDLSWVYFTFANSYEAFGVRLVGGEEYEFFASVLESGSLGVVRLWNSSDIDAASHVPLGYPETGYYLATNETRLPYFLNRTVFSVNASIPASAFWSAVALEAGPQMPQGSILISSSSAAFSDSNRTEVLGSFHSDFELEPISALLQGLQSYKGSLSYVVEPDGSLIAVSNGEPVVVSDVHGAVYRRKAVDLNEGFIVCTALHMMERARNPSLPFDVAESSSAYETTCRGHSLHFGLRRLTQSGLRWVVVVAVPQADFTFELRRDSAISLGLVLSGLSLAVFALNLTFWLLRLYLRSLYKQAEKMIFLEDERSLEGTLLKAVDSLRAFGEFRSADPELAAVVSRTISMLTTHCGYLYEPDFSRVAKKWDPEVRTWLYEAFMMHAPQLFLPWGETSGRASQSLDGAAAVVDGEGHVDFEKLGAAGPEDDLPVGAEAHCAEAAAIRRPLNPQPSADFVRQSTQISLSFLGQEMDIEAVLSKLDSWEFSVVELEEACRRHRRSVISVVSYAIFQRRRLFDAPGGRVHMENFVSFLNDLQPLFREANPYHNSLHGADVLQCVHYLLLHGFEELLSDGLGIVALLFAALALCVSHPGGDNEFHCDSSSAAGLMYSERSVTQNVSLCAFFSLLDRLDQSGCSPLVLLSRQEKLMVRRSVMALLLATDNARHFQLLGEARTRFESGFFTAQCLRLSEATPPGSGSASGGRPEGIGQASVQEDRFLVSMLLLKFASTCYAARPLDSMREWAERAMEERFLAGDSREDEGAPRVSFSTRDYTSTAKAQHVNMTLIVAPVLETLNALVPLPGLMEQFSVNQQSWSDQMYASERQGLI